MFDVHIKIVDRERGVIQITPTETISEEIDFTIISDRNATATYAIGAALLGEELIIENAHLVDTKPLWSFLREVGARVEVDETAGRAVINRMRPRSLSRMITGEIPPKFSTDWGPMVQVLLTQLPGTTEYYDTVFSNRFAHVPELVKMGAHALLHNVEHGEWVDGSEFTQTGEYDKARFEKSTLHGAEVTANDIRNGAALVLAGLLAEGETVIHQPVHIKRGYEDMVAVYKQLGADIDWNDSV